jgi:ABC-type glycerol-3-phosphate transport system substrate-binding protein
LLLLAGCPTADTGPGQQPVDRPLEGVKLRLLVVDDPALATAIGRLRGEWNAQTGADLQVEQANERQLEGVESLPADALLCPSHLLGPLAERGLVAPVPQRQLRSSQWADVFELPKLREAAWGTEVKAVPFGSPVLICYYRADLLEKLGRRLPQTWADYQELARLLSDSPEKPPDGGAWCGTIEPLAPGWAGLVLLARAAPYAKHRDNYSTLFNIDTMEPLLATPPMIRALEELVSAAKSGPADPFAFDPAAARAAFWRGQCGMALTWPTAAESFNRDPKGSVSEKGSVNKKIRVGFAELPGSRKVFNLGSRAWDTRTDDEDPHVPLLAIAGRLGVVGAKSPHCEAAFELLAWLSDSQNSLQASTASPVTTLFRHSHLSAPGPWVEKPVPAPLADQYAMMTEATLRREQWLGALRLPGRAEYLAALDEAVRSAVRGEKPPVEALLQAETQWKKITERLGVERQRAAYLHSLGL